MRIVCIGGGPAGLYFAILMKLRDPAHRVTVIERNRPDDTFGWGVVFSDETLRNLNGGDPPTEQRITDSFRALGRYRHPLSAAASSARADTASAASSADACSTSCRNARAELGVELVFDRDVHDVDRIRRRGPHRCRAMASTARSARVRRSLPAIDRRSHQPLRLARHAQALRGLHVHLCRDRMRLVPGARLSLQCGYLDVHRRDTRRTWRAAGLDRMDVAESIAFCERLFAPWLDGHALLTNMRHLRGSQFINFHRVSNETWSTATVVLMGDAAHTAHFSIGSGHQARAGGCHRSRPVHRPVPRRHCTCALPL